MGRVNVTSPTGEDLSVDESEAGALPPGWTVAEAPAPEAPTDIGEAAEAGVLGLGRAATFGLSDLALSETTNLLAGEQARKHALHDLSDLREKHPIASTAGEIGGLFVGPGEAIPAIGEAAERGIAGALAPRIGEGLLSHVATTSARAGIESALLGAQNQITEDTLGDHQYNAEAILSAAGKDFLLGGATGAPLGALGYGLRSVLGRTSGLAVKAGPLSDAVLDDVAGAEGAGRGMLDNARASEGFVEGVQRTGATSDQAVSLAKDLETMGKARPEAGVGAGLVDHVADVIADDVHGGERAKLIKQHYADMAASATDADSLLDTQARKLADVGTKAMRGLEDTVNDVHFTERPDQIAKLADPALYSAARDASIRMGQDVGAVVTELDALPTKGGGELAVSRLKKQIAEFGLKTGRLSEDGGAAGSRDAFMNAYKLKQAVGKFSGFGKPAFMRTPAESAFAELYERMRVGLEDRAAFGPAGDATREWNESFSNALGRRNDFGKRFAVSVDQVSGVPVPELDAGKVKGFLSQLGGAESDQGVKTTEAFIDGLRNRAAKILKYGDLTEGQRGNLSAGQAALDDFEETFKSAAKDAEAANRVRAMTIQEGHGIGGLAGIVGDVFTRPGKTMERLAHVRQTISHVEEGIRKGIRKSLSIVGSPSGVVGKTAAPRAKEQIIAEMEHVRSMQNDPAALDAASQRIVGDLGKYAPKTADQARLAAQRVLMYLAREAPPATTTDTGVFAKPQSRYSDIQIYDWETKRHAAFDVRTVANDLQHGVLNRDGIEAAEFAQPKMFAKLQEIAMDELQQMRAKGQLDAMPYQQKAAYATLLKIPADQTWTGDFIAMMQATKAAPPPVSNSGKPGGKSPQMPRKSNQKPVAGMFQTESQNIEAGGQVQ